MILTKVLMSQCRLENFYYRLLLLVSGFMDNSKIAIDALSVW